MIINTIVSYIGIELSFRFLKKLYTIFIHAQVFNLYKDLRKEEEEISLLNF